METIIYLVAFIFVVGILLWGVKSFPYIDEGIKKIAFIVIVVAASIYTIYALIPLIHLPR